MGLWMMAGAWSAKELTDGHVPEFMLEEFGATKAQAECLVHVGLWKAERNGYVFHDWAEYQPSREKVLAEREAAKSRMKQARERKRSGEQVPNVQENFGGTSGEVRQPRPDPTRPDQESKDSSSPRARETRLPKDWAPTAEHIKRAKELGVDVVNEAENFRLFADTHDRHAANWNGAFTMWLKKAKPSRPKNADWALRV